MNFRSNVHAAYQTSFDNKVILESGDATVNHIDTQTKPKLGAASINGSVGVLQESLTDMTAIANSNSRLLLLFKFMLELSK